MVIKQAAIFGSIKYPLFAHTHVAQFAGNFAAHHTGEYNTNHGGRKFKYNRISYYLCNGCKWYQRTNQLVRCLYGTYRTHKKGDDNYDTQRAHANFNALMHELFPIHAHVLGPGKHAFQH